MKTIGVRYAYGIDDHRLVDTTKINVLTRDRNGTVKNRTVKMTEAEYEAFNAIVARLLLDHKKCIRVEKKTLPGGNVEFKSFLIVQDV